MHSACNRRRHRMRNSNLVQVAQMIIISVVGQLVKPTAAAAATATASASGTACLLWRVLGIDVVVVVVSGRKVSVCSLFFNYYYHWAELTQVSNTIVNRLHYITFSMFSLGVFSSRVGGRLFIEESLQHSVDSDVAKRWWCGCWRASFFQVIIAARQACWPMLLHPQSGPSSRAVICWPLNRMLAS